MTTTTAPTFPTDNLLTCAKCGCDVRLSQEPEYRYTCGNSCSLTFKADELNRLLIAEITAVVVTDATFPALKANFLETLAEVVGHDPENQPSDDLIRQYVTDPDTFLRKSNAPTTAELLAKLIDRVELETDRATVQYALALPQGSTLAGSRRQEIELPTWVTI